jgi:hypothetical protein
MAKTAKLAPNTDNLTLGKGILYFDRQDANGNSTGELDLGEVQNFNIMRSETTKEFFTSREKIRKRTLIVPVEEKWAGKFTAFERSKENLILAVRGDTLQYLTQSAGSTSVTKTGFRDRWIDTGYRQISSVVVSHGATTFTLNYDYKVDLATGRIMPLSNGTIFEQEQLTIAFSYAAIKQPKIIPSQRETKGFLRFVSNNDQGPNWEAQVWVAEIRCDGEINFITEDWANLPFSFDIDEDVENHPTVPYFRII